MANRSFHEATAVDEVIDRLGHLDAASPRRWGTMTAHEMVCHLSDSFLAVLGDRPASPAETWLSRTVVKWVALHTPLQWPHGVPTRPEVNPKALGTKPVEFARDRQKVVDLIRRFVQPTTQCGKHPGFGTLTRDEWMIWGYRHLDHHLRQFGL